MRRLVGIVGASAVVVMLVSACGSSGGGGASTSGSKVSVGFSTITLTDPFFVRLNNGMNSAAKAQGVKLSIQNPNGDPAAQVNQLESFITQKRSAVIVDAIDPNSVLPAIRQAKAAGIPVVAVDEVLASVPEVSAGVGNDNFAVGQELGRTVADATKGESGPIEVAAIQTLNAPIENTRVAGFIAGTKTNPNIRFVGRGDAKFSAETAATQVENLLDAHPKLKWIFGTGGIYEIGALSAIKAKNKQGQVRMVGLDLTKELVPAMRSGIYFKAALSDATGMGKLAITVAKKLADGQKVPRKNSIAVTYVTKANLDKYAAKATG